MAKSRMKGAYRLTGEMLAGLVEALEDEVGRDADVDAMLDSVRVSKELRRKIAKLIVGERSNTSPVWRSVITGTKMNLGEVIAGLSARDYSMSFWALELFRRMPFARVATRLNLAKVTSFDLGFKGSATTEEIFARAHERGFGFCPAEVGPALREQYSDQPMDEHLRIGMEPIDVFGDNPRVFSVSHDGGGCWLGTDLARPACFWDSKHSWIFLHSNQ